MDHRTRSIADADLDREVEAALGVDPSPWLIARVRATVTNQPMRSRVPWAWAIGSVCAVNGRRCHDNRNGDDGVARLKPSPTAICRALPQCRALPPCRALQQWRVFPMH